MSCDIICGELSGGSSTRSSKESCMRIINRASWAGLICDPNFACNNVNLLWRAPTRAPMTSTQSHDLGVSRGGPYKDRATDTANGIVRGMSGSIQRELLKMMIDQELAIVKRWEC